MLGRGREVRGIKWGLGRERGERERVGLERGREAREKERLGWGRGKGGV